MDARFNADLVAYANQFKQNWTKARDSIFAACDVLVSVKSKFPNDWETFKDMLPVHDGVLKKLVPIGKDPRLTKPQVYKRLPSSYSIIYEITQLTDEELKAALEEGRISTRMHRDEFIKWRDARRKGTRVASAHAPGNLRVYVLGLSIFATIRTDGSLSSRKAIKLTQELDEIAKRYGALIDYDKRGEVSKALAELTRELQQKLALAVPCNLHVDDRELTLIDAALWQHQGGDAPYYAADHPGSIQNRDHPYSIQKGWNSELMLSEMKRRRIVTTRMPIKDREELGEARCLQLALWYLETSDIPKRRKHKRALERIARAQTKDSRTAEWCLGQIVPFARVRGE